ncbi:hypothetical protein [Aureliella helgolandensis]|uniref:Uncharacterized protein n=1 Tax=Aureliella helgolandensis TaxID=2527968 RepID=A0A518GBN3_9BACT|nr:hypothetical protein [Aureliella helgolandensis]QDV25940.1 hypothetical protein Q31a_43090 [Aureliella helgolandensis]
MRFSVQAVLELTTFVGFVFAIAMIPYSGPYFCFVVLHGLAFVMPLLVMFTAIFTCKQNGTQLEIENNRSVAFVLRLWGYCGLTVGLFWAFVLLHMLYTMATR